MTASRLIFLLAVALLACGCDSREHRESVSAMTRGGNPDRGATLIPYYGCSSCHTIPGIPGATAVVGPPLMSFSARPFIAGMSPNTPDALTRWIQNPKSLNPHTAMPNIGVNEPDARDIAAYLYTLR